MGGLKCFGACFRYALSFGSGMSSIGHPLNHWGSHFRMELVCFVAAVFSCSLTLVHGGPLRNKGAGVSQPCLSSFFTNYMLGSYALCCRRLRSLRISALGVSICWEKMFCAIWGGVGALGVFWVALGGVACGVGLGRSWGWGFC